MQYNPTPDLIIFALFLFILGMIIRLTDLPRRGATLGNVKRHQRKRAKYMAENGGYYLREHRTMDEMRYFK